MSDLQAFTSQGWADHADDAPGVARRLPQGLALVGSDDDVARLATLAHHVFGDHLAAWAEGRAFLDQLTALGRHGEAGAGSLRRCQASLALGAGEMSALDGLGVSDAIRVLSMAASNLAHHDATRATALFQQSLAQAQAAGLPDDDPMNRALAVMGNSMAATLEQKSPRSQAEGELMLAAAQVGRTYWEKAGSWLEVERAEYRLAMSWWAAGDAPRAREHASRCLEIVGANGSVALERFFGLEALALAAKAAGDYAASQRAVTDARQAFEALAEEDRGWCRATLDKLAAA